MATDDGATAIPMAVLLLIMLMPAIWMTDPAAISAKPAVLDALIASAVHPSLMNWLIPSHTAPMPVMTSPVVCILLSCLIGLRGWRMRGAYLK